MSTYGYIHAATGTNECHAQHFAILSFATENRFGQVHVCHDSDQVQLNGGRPIFSGMVANLQRGDILIVTDFFRLGSSTAEILEILAILSRTGVLLYIVNSRFRLDDNAQAQVVAMACTLVTKIEQELSCRPLPASMPNSPLEEKRPTASTQTRRSKLDGQEDRIRALMSDDVSLSQIARQLMVSRPTLTDFIRTRRILV